MWGVSFFGGVLAFALVTGLFQAAMLRAPWRRVLSWTTWNVVALAAGVLAAAMSSMVIGPATFRPRVPLLFYLMAFVIYPGVAGLTIGLVTVGPLGEAHDARPRRHRLTVERRRSDRGCGGLRVQGWK
jgi:hypothetical protein